jgi:hypothetical protein
MTPILLISEYHGNLLACLLAVTNMLKVSYRGYIDKEVLSSLIVVTRREKGDSGDASEFIANVVDNTFRADLLHSTGSILVRDMTVPV